MISLRGSGFSFLKLLLFCLFFLLQETPQSQGAAGKPCAMDEGCITLFVQAFGDCIITASVTHPPLGEPWIPADIQVNHRSHPLILRAYSEQTLRSVSTFPHPETVFHESDNEISIAASSSCSEGAAIEYINYYAPHTLEPKRLCEESVPAGKSVIKCRHLRLSIKDIDEGLYQQIEQLKREIADYQSKIQADREEIAHYPEKFRDLEAKIGLLNRELGSLGSDFDSIDPSLLAELMKEDPRLRALYEDLKKGVSELKKEVEEEIAFYQKELQEVLEGLERNGGEEIEKAEEEVEWDRESLNDPSDLKDVPFDDRLYDEVIREVLSKLDRAFRQGKRTTFLSEVRSWKKLQDYFLFLFQKSRTTLTELQVFEQKQKQVHDFIQKHLDAYGFFRDSRVPDSARRILVTEIQERNTAVSRSLVEELTQWNQTLNPSQEKLIAEIQAYPSLDQGLQKVALIQGGSPQQQTAQQWAVEAAQGSLKSLSQAAPLARSLSAPQAFEEALSEVQCFREVALAFIDLATGVLPGGSLGRDLYEVLTGKDLLTGKELSASDRATAAAGAISLGFGSKLKIPAKTSKLLRELKGLLKASKRGKELIRSGAGKAIREGEKRVEAGSTVKGPVLKTNSEAYIKAKELGFEKINERIKDQAVFKKGNVYITRDIDGHNGGAWKVANSVEDLMSRHTRLGTYDINLNKIGK